jgi:histone methylation protein DOT1
MMRALQSLIEELEQDRSLDEPERLRERIEAVDRLDIYLPDGRSPVLDANSADADFHLRARSLYTHFESANFELYQTIRGEIQRATGPYRLLRWVPDRTGGPADLAKGDGYDYLDELISGVLDFEEPDAEGVAPAQDMVFYQPTPARHIFDLIDRIALTERDVLVDLGSGLGHVPLLVSICTSARSIGVEVEAAYVDCARRCAERLNRNNVTFLQQDARFADLSSGTVFYLYTPFTGNVLRTVLDRLQREAIGREIRICAFGPCTPIIAREPWLESLGVLEADRVAIFSSRH